MSTLQKQYHTTSTSQNPQEEEIQESIREESLYNKSDAFMISNTISSGPDKPNVKPSKCNSIEPSKQNKKETKNKPTKHLSRSTKDKLKTPTLKIKQRSKPEAGPTTPKDKSTSTTKQ